MPEETKTPGASLPPLPPKINLRKTGVLKVGSPGEEAGTETPSAAAAPAAQPVPSGFSLTPKPVEPAAPTPTPAPVAAAAQAKPASSAEGPSPAIPAAPKPLQAKPATTALSGGLSSKNETSKIPLEAARAMTEDELATTAPKTIRIRPTAAVSAAAPATIRVAKPAGQPAPSAASPSPAPPPATAKLAGAASYDEKRKTSRISLEAALGGARKAEAPGAPEGGAPKTIRLKRPTEAATVKAVGAPGEPVNAKTAELDKVLRKTAQLDEEAEAVAAGPSPTRRKTIRVKRPTQRPAVKGGKKVVVSQEAGVIAGPDGAAAPAMAPAPETIPAAAPSDEPGIVFSLGAVAAILVTFLVIYVLACQAFGPNSSLTKLSYALPELDLAWPGKITIMR